MKMVIKDRKRCNILAEIEERKLASKSRVVDETEFLTPVIDLEKF